MVYPCQKPLRAHLWTDGAAQPAMLGESAASADDECAWVEMAVVTKGTGTQLVRVPTDRA